jgi:hypothetical protein
MTIKTIEVIEYQSAVNRKLVHGGYQLAMLYRDCVDSQYDWIPHPAVFRTKERAEAFLVKMNRNNINIKNWGKSIPTYGVI